jgi:hypothetical protein
MDMTKYSIETCANMISHYNSSLKADDKPARWYELCRLSIATWEVQLQRAKGEILFACEVA